MSENSPLNWEQQTLEQVATVNYGKRIVKADSPRGEFYVYGGGDKTFTTNTFNRENNLVVSRFGVSKKCTRFVKGKFFLNNSGLTLASKNENYLSQAFLDWQIYSLNDVIYSYAKGITQKNLDVRLLKKTKLLIPKTTKEQEEIVTILNNAQKAIELRTECIEYAKDLILSLYLETFGNTQANQSNYNTLIEICNKITDETTGDDEKNNSFTSIIKLVQEINPQDKEPKNKETISINQQELFIQKIQKIEEYIQKQQQEAENANDLLNALLNHAFKGELTRKKYGDSKNE